MKHNLWFICMIATLLWHLPTKAQSEDNAGLSIGDAGMICLNPYIHESEEIDETTKAVMLSKLNQIANAKGMAGAGFDNRFIITAHLQNVKSVQTQTFLKGKYVFFISD